MLEQLCEELRIALNDLDREEAEALVSDLKFEREPG